MEIKIKDALINTIGTTRLLLPSVLKLVIKGINMWTAKIKSNFSLIFLAILLSACASPGLYNIATHPVPSETNPNATIVIEDLRPEQDRVLSRGSIFVGSNDYGIWTLGDNAFQPAVIEALRQSVQQAVAVSSHPPGKTEIQVNRLFVQNNMQARFLREGTMGAGLTPIGISIVESLTGKKIELGVNKTQPFVLAFFQGKINVDGEVRNLVVSKANNYIESDQQSLDQTMDKTMRDFLQTIALEATRQSRGFSGGREISSKDASTTANQPLPTTKPGKFSYTVENMAKSVGCLLGSGAYLTSGEGPIESYRIDCENGTSYLARCEYGVCTQQQQ